jgi:hypothetical protein
VGIFVMKQQLFAKFRMPFLGSLVVIFALAVGLPLLVMSSADNPSLQTDYAIAGAYTMSGLLGAVSLAVLVFGLVLLHQVSGLQSKSKSNSQGSSTSRLSTGPSASSLQSSSSKSKKNAMARKLRISIAALTTCFAVEVTLFAASVGIPDAEVSPFTSMLVVRVCLCFLYWCCVVACLDLAPTLLQTGSLVSHLFYAVDAATLCIMLALFYKGVQTKVAAVLKRTAGSSKRLATKGSSRKVLRKRESKTKDQMLAGGGATSSVLGSESELELSTVQA